MEERRKRKRKPIHPGRVLSENYLKPLGLTITETAERLKISRKLLSNILNAHVSISIDLSLRLSRAFKTTPELWVNMQKNYDLWCVENESKEWKSIKTIPQLASA